MHVLCRLFEKICFSWFMTTTLMGDLLHQSRLFTDLKNKSELIFQVVIAKFISLYMIIPMVVFCLCSFSDKPCCGFNSSSSLH